MSESWSSPEGAESWRRSTDARNAIFAEATELMLDCAGVRAGIRVLDIATGTGDTAIVAAKRVGAHGSVVATDESQVMIDVATAGFREAGLANVEARAMDAAKVDLPDGSFDAAICRNGLMFVRDLPAALSRVRRVLKSGGKFAAIVWSTIDRNPLHKIPIDIALSFGPLPVPQPDLLDAYSLSQPGLMESRLSTAGFANVEVRRVKLRRSSPSPAKLIQLQHDSVPVQALFAHLTEQQRTEAWERFDRTLAEFQDADGSITLSGETLVASGKVP